MKKLKIKDQDLFKVLKEQGQIVYMGKKTYIFLPYWFEFEEKNEDVFVYPLNNIPLELQMRLKSVRQTSENINKERK